MEFFRQHRWLSFLLFSLLFVILLGKVLWPQYLRAQSALREINNQNNVASAAPNSAVPTCAQSGNINVEEYMAPKCEGACPGIASTAVVPGARHVGNVSNSVEWVNGNTFKQRSGGVHFLYQVTGDAITFLQDTIWSPPPFYCEGTQTEAMYRVFQGSNPNSTSQWGGRVAYKNMACGGVVESTQFIKTYRKNDALEENPLMQNLVACNVPGQTNQVVSNTKQLIFQGPAKCNGKDVEAISFVNTTGAGQGEVYMYCKGFGLCAFYSEINFSSPDNQPSSWKADTDICALKTTPKTSGTYFEYNIERASTDKILNNFYDEYSVACLPKEEYEIEIQNRNRCDLTEKGGCNGWNVTGSLSISATGKMFGLYRNEAQATDRSASGDAATNRFESLETYLGSRNPSESFAAQSSVSKPTVKDVDVRQSPIFKLTDLKQQCEFVKNKARAVVELCDPKNRIEGEIEKLKQQSSSANDTLCALDSTIPGTTTTHTDLWNQVKDKSCEDIMNPSPGDERLRDTILATPLAMETAYRPAFIVAVTKFEGKKQEDDPNKNSTTTVGTNVDGNDQSAKNDYFYVIDYMEVKVPALGSDFIEPDMEKSNPEKNNEARNSYRDPLMLSADVLQQKDVQETVKQKQIEERSAVRTAAKTLPGGMFGKLIGPNGEPILCYKNGKLRPCTAENNSQYDPNTDALPPALVTFINASALKPNSILPCQGNEKDFYSPENKKKIAEEAVEIVSSLESKDIGNVKKKTSISVPFSVSIKNLKDQVSVNAVTELYFVTPHNYNLEYAQRSWLNFLTLDQQDKLEDLGLLVDKAENSNLETAAGSDQVLDPEKLSPLLRTELNDTVEGSEVQRGGFQNDLLTEPGAPRDIPVDDEENKNFFITSAKFAALKENGQQKKHPLFWQLGGQAASLPTRLLAMVTTPLSHELNKYTRGCSDTDPNHATENWLLGRCKSKEEDRQTTCDPGDAVTICKNFGGTCTTCNSPACVAGSGAGGTGQTAKISDGLIALAIEASEYTCTPPEILVGVLAKESSGLNFQNEPVTGDPNEISYRDKRCEGPYDRIVGSPSCGIFSIFAKHPADQVATYPNLYKECLENLSVDVGDGKRQLEAYPLDSRKSGVSMCIAAGWMWRGMYINRYGYTFSDRQTTFGCGGTMNGAIEKKSYTIEDLKAAGYSDEDIAFGIGSFHGSFTDGAIQNYLGFIDQYKSRVDEVRGKLSQCR